ncbi:MAG: NADH-quinone oxidoreductase subunit NuoH [Anaerolineae bacterium]|nr:NADH-quinone oxidoreductase subunit NuoH [Anaerolineae bacterium]
MAESSLKQPPSRGFRISPVLVIIGLVVLALIGLVTIDVIRILEGGNQESIIYRAGDSILKFVFDPTTRVAPENIVVCQKDAACSTTHAFLFSAIVLLVVITGFAYTTLLERRFIAFFQSRVGPNRVGPLGLLQPAADAVKLITKEDITPAGAYWFVWFISPMIKAVPVLVVLAVIPLGPDLLIPWFDGKWYQIPLSLADPNVGILWLLAITSIGTYGLVLAGWSSNNKYAMLGGLRASAQMISYELSLGLTMAVPVMIVGSMSVGDISHAQPMFWNWFVFQNPLAAGVLFVALLAEISRAPFDLPEAEQELTAGFMTEYSGMKFALFMMAEYLGMIAISLIVTSLYFGGYQDGFGLVDRVPILGPLVLIGKVVLMLIFMIWIRATLPRIRYDRLMHFGWKVMLPLALIAVSWTAISLVVGDTFKSDFAYAVAAGIFFVVIVAGGYLFMRRSGEAAVEAEEDLANDPIITGERHGIGFAILTAVGVLIAIPMGLISFTIEQLEKIAEWGGKREEPEKALAVAPAVAQPPVLQREAPVQTAPAAAVAAAAAPKPAPAAASAPKPAAGGKAKFDKEAMLAKIREKKAQKGG